MAAVLPSLGNCVWRFDNSVWSPESVCVVFSHHGRRRHLASDQQHRHAMLDDLEVLTVVNAECGLLRGGVYQFCS